MISSQASDKSQLQKYHTLNDPALLFNDTTGEPDTLTKDGILRILNKEGEYYPTIHGSDNPYRDGYITEPPKKPRASYLFFQGVYRSIYQIRHKGATVGEVMQRLGDTWKGMTPEQQAPFVELAQEEVHRYETERALLEKAQLPTQLWQPLRRCLMVLDRLCSDGFSNIFLEPVSILDFPDYSEYVDQPMDLGTVRKKLGSKKYQSPEQFGRDMRKVIILLILIHSFIYSFEKDSTNLIILV